MRGSTRKLTVAFFCAGFTLACSDDAVLGKGTPGGGGNAGAAPTGGSTGSGGNTGGSGNTGGAAGTAGDAAATGGASGASGTGPGSLDPTFGSQGIVTLTASFPYAIAIQTDDKILVLNGPVAHQTPPVYRYSADGAADTSFGNDGVTSTPLVDKTLTFERSAVALTADGKIVIASNVTDEAATPPANLLMLERYNPDGSPDSSFGTGGFVFGDQGFTGDSILPSFDKELVCQPDGKIVVLDKQKHIWRFNPDGSVDTQFGTDGELAVSANWLAVQNDKLLFSSDQVYRLDADGLADTTFGNGGGTVLNGIDPIGAANLSDDKIVIGGYGQVGVGVARILPNGALDPSFNVDGTADLTLPVDQYDYLWGGFAFQSNGDILFGGRAQKDTKAGLLLGRVRADGVFDPGFGDGGLVIGEAGYDETVFDVDVQSGDRIVILVQGAAASPAPHFLARYAP
jgi:uncharacterized delta-60 repeat protein